MLNRKRGRDRREAALFQRLDAHFFKPDHISRIMILQTDVAGLRTFRLAFGFVPLFALRKRRTRGVQSRDALAIQVNQDSIAVERDEHRLPFAEFFRRGR